MEAVKTQLPGATCCRGFPSCLPAPRAWLSELRAEALERANALAVPTTRDEDWRFTDLSPLYRTSFQRGEAPGAASPAIETSGWTLPEAGSRLVFLDGHFVPALSDLHAEAGVTVAPLAAAVAESNPVLPEHLGPVRRLPGRALHRSQHCLAAGRRADRAGAQSRRRQAGASAVRQHACRGGELSPRAGGRGGGQRLHVDRGFRLPARGTRI